MQTVKVYNYCDVSPHSFIVNGYAGDGLANYVKKFGGFKCATLPPSASETIGLVPITKENGKCSVVAALEKEIADLKNMQKSRLLLDEILTTSGDLIAFLYLKVVEGLQEKYNYPDEWDWQNAGNILKYKNLITEFPKKAQRAQVLQKQVSIFCVCQQKPDEHGNHMFLYSQALSIFTVCLSACTHTHNVNESAGV